MASSSDAKGLAAAPSSSEPDFDFLFHQAPALYLVLDPDLIIRAVNDAYCRATMTRRGQIVGRHVFDVFPDNPDDPAADGVANLRQSLARVLELRRPDTMAIQKYDIRKPEPEGGDFEERYWNPVNTPILGRDGEVQAILHCVEDVTELVLARKSQSTYADMAREQQLAIDRLRTANRELAERMEQIKALRRDSEFLAMLAQSSVDPIITFEMDGKVTFWNAAAEEMFGYGAAEIIGRHIDTILPPELKSEQTALLSRLKNGEKVQGFETLRRAKDGTEIAVALTVSPIRDARPEIVGASQVVHDITERKRIQTKINRLQEELIHLSRWNTMGLLASTIAHELSQPLTAAINYIRAAHRTLGGLDTVKVSQARAFLDQAVEETKLAGGIMRTLREFIDKRKTSRTVEDINRIVEETLVLGTAGSADVKAIIETRLMPGLPPVLVDKVQIQQVLLNLVRNGVDAMAGSARRALIVATGMDEPGFVAVSVTDSGPGIAPEVTAKLFQPFVTTKENGMGIGLTICQSIVEAHGGRIWGQSDGGRGAMFRFRLPIAKPIENQNAA